MAAAKDIKGEMVLINQISLAGNSSNISAPANFNRSVSIDYDGDIDGFI
jgi:hypothetical protein